MGEGAEEQRDSSGFSAGFGLLWKPRCATGGGQSTEGGCGQKCCLHPLSGGLWSSVVPAQSACSRVAEEDTL